jgi:hypothetical protein
MTAPSTISAQRRTWSAASKYCPIIPPMRSVSVPVKPSAADMVS